MAASKVRVRGSWEGDPTDPGWYVHCPDAWIGPYDNQADAELRAQRAAAPCVHVHTVVPVGLQGDTGSDTLKP